MKTREKIEKIESIVRATNGQFNKKYLVKLNPTELREVENVVHSVCQWGDLDLKKIKSIAI